MYQYPAGYRMGEYIYPSFTEDGSFVTVEIQEQTAQQSIGASIVSGAVEEVTRYRIRTRCGQARVVITVLRHGHLAAIFDLRDLDPRVTADVTFDPADLSAYYASIGLSKTS